MTPADKTRVVKSLASAIGFDLVGVARAEPSTRGDYYRDWLARGHAGSMHYLERNVELRLDPRGLLDGARSIIVLAVVYRRLDGYIRPETTSDAAAPQKAVRGRVAQYARGRDYHLVLRRMIDDLVGRMRAEIGEAFQWRPCVDTTPLLERDVARLAGLGWIGKNTCLLNARQGSYLLLGELVTTLELTPDEPVEERCRSCTRCIDACPTGALVAPRTLDATRCIAYLTIEHRGEIPPEIQTQMGRWVFGCDVCQQVCPYNARAPVGTNPDIMATETPAELPLLELPALRSSGYRRLVAGTALGRATRRMWQRNAEIAAGNAFETSDAPHRVIDGGAARPDVASE